MNETPLERMPTGLTIMGPTVAVNWQQLDDWMCQLAIGLGEVRLRLWKLEEEQIARESGPQPTTAKVTEDSRLDAELASMIQTTPLSPLQLGGLTVLGHIDVAHCSGCRDLAVTLRSWLEMHVQGVVGTSSTSLNLDSVRSAAGIVAESLDSASNVSKTADPEMSESLRRAMAGAKTQLAREDIERDAKSGGGWP